MRLRRLARLARRYPVVWGVLLAFVLTSQTLASTMAWCLESDSSVHITSTVGPCVGHHASHALDPHDAADNAALEAHASGASASTHDGSMLDGHEPRHHDAAHGLHVSAQDLLWGASALPASAAQPALETYWLPVAWVSIDDLHPLAQDFALAAASGPRSSHYAGSATERLGSGSAAPGQHVRLLI